MPGIRPRNGLPVARPYVYRGTGHDELTGDLTAAEIAVETITAGGAVAEQELSHLYASSYHTEREVARVMLRMCRPCYDDDCAACEAGGCTCACRDEPAPDPRCDDCGSLLRSTNHRILCRPAKAVRRG